MTNISRLFSRELLAAESELSQGIIWLFCDQFRPVKSKEAFNHSQLFVIFGLGMPN